MTAYRPTHSKENMSFCMQNKETLAEQNCYADPQKQFLIDLTKLCKQWNKNKEEIIIMTDMNDTLCGSQITQFICNAKLKKLIPTMPTGTHQEVSKCIDFILGSKNMSTMIKDKGHLPFHSGPFISDHRACFIDINSEALFKNKMPELCINPQRGVNSKNKTTTQKFWKVLDNTQIKNTHSTMEKLNQKTV